jgi:hypothetical protein
MYTLANVDLSKCGDVVSKLPLDDIDEDQTFDAKRGTVLNETSSSTATIEMAVFSAP